MRSKDIQNFSLIIKTRSLSCQRKLSWLKRLNEWNGLKDTNKVINYKSNSISTSLHAKVWIPFILWPHSSAIEQTNTQTNKQTNKQTKTIFLLSYCWFAFKNDSRCVLHIRDNLQTCQAFFFFFFFFSCFCVLRLNLLLLLLFDKLAKINIKQVIWTLLVIDLWKFSLQGLFDFYVFLMI